MPVELELARLLDRRHQPNVSGDLVAQPEAVRIIDGCHVGGGRQRPDPWNRHQTLTDRLGGGLPYDLSPHLRGATESLPPDFHQRLEHQPQVLALLQSQPSDLPGELRLLDLTQLDPVRSQQTPDP